MTVRRSTPSDAGRRSSAAGASAAGSTTTGAARRRGTSLAAVTAMAMSCGALLAGCGNADTTSINGRTALTKGADGAPVAVVHLCEGGVDSLYVAGGRNGASGDATNTELGELQASSPQSGQFSVALTAPAAPWKATRAVTLPASRSSEFIVLASQRSKDTQATQVGASLAQIDKLTAGQVISDNGIVMSEKDFHAGACKPN